MTSNDLVGLVFATALKSVWIMGATAILLLAWRRGAASARHFIWLSATLSLLFLPLAPLVAPRWTVPAWVNHSAFVRRLSASHDVNAPPAVAISGEAERPAERERISTLGGHGSTIAPQQRSRDLRAIVPWVWIAGAAATLLGCAGRFWRVRRTAAKCRVLVDSRVQALAQSAQGELGMNRRVRLLQSQERVMPMTWGWWRAVVLLPSEALGWDHTKLQMVLRHELAHVKRRDCLTQSLGNLVRALYWFNPLLWLATAQMRAERERACDDLVLTTGARPSEYAGHLLEIARQFSCWQAMAAIPIARASGLERRLRAVVDARREHGRLRPVKTVLLLAAVAALFWCVGGWKMAAADNAAAPSEDPEALRNRQTREIFFGDQTAKALHERQMAQIKAFSQAKEKQSEALAATAGEGINPIFYAFFNAAISGDATTVTNMYVYFKSHHPQYSNGATGPLPLPPLLSETVRHLEVQRLDAQINFENYSNVLSKLKSQATGTNAQDKSNQKLDSVIQDAQARLDKSKALYTAIEHREKEILSATRASLRTSYWQPALEICLAYFDVTAGEPKYTQLFADGVIDSIPAGSIYFGGTDPGRGLITAFSKSHADANPFFTLTQNALADNSYLQYLQAMYGAKLYIPTTNDSQNCFETYVADAKRRLEHDTQSPGEPRQIKPGENVEMKGSTLQVSGQVAVMAINGLLAKVIFDKNPDREFYIEESFPLDWMYPYLEPHGIIMKINREQLTEMGDDIIKRDQDYWGGIISGMVGDWLTPATPVRAVVDFVEQTYAQKDLSNFQGNPRFIANDDAMRMFSKQRCNIADLYNWRMNHAAGDPEKNRMAQAADLAYRQAWAICPYSPEVVGGFVQFLVSEHRNDEALLVAETADQTATQMGEPNAQIHDLAEGLRRQRQ